MVPAVRVVTIAFHLPGRNGKPPTVLASSRIYPTFDYSNLGRITIGHIAAGFRWIVRHAPCRVEFFVECQVLNWMALMLLRLGSSAQEDEQRDGTAHGGLRRRETDRY